MTRDDADEAFDCLGRHARAIATPNLPADALKLVDTASLAELQRTAIIHYISVGPAVVNLAYRVLKAGTATFVAAGFAAQQTAGSLEQGDPAALRELFAARMIALSAGLLDAAPAERASRLIDALGERLTVGRAELAAASPTGAGVGDLLEAAGIAYVLTGK